MCTLVLESCLRRERARVLNNPVRVGPSCRFLVHALRFEASRSSLLPRRPGPAAAIPVPGTRSGTGLNARARGNERERQRKREHEGLPVVKQVRSVRARLRPLSRIARSPTAHDRRSFGRYFGPWPLSPQFSDRSTDFLDESLWKCIQTSRCNKKSCSNAIQSVRFFCKLKLPYTSLTK